MPQFDGLFVDMRTIALRSDAKSRSISPENFTGEKNTGGMATSGVSNVAARELGQGWKLSPAIEVKPGETYTLADIAGSGAIQQIWMTPPWPYRDFILRMYWDDQAHPSVECPLGDFFAQAWNPFAQVSSLAVCVNPGSGFNCYWPMPFRKRCRITIEYRGEKPTWLFYQINYALGPVPEDALYFHAQFRRVNPLPYKEVYTIVDGIRGSGQFVGTYMAWGQNNNGWWGEGEIKFYLDGDQWPTICGTGTEDYFCGSYGFLNRFKNEKGVDVERVQEFTTPYAGMPQVIHGDGHYQVQRRYGLYRWHITDPIRFEQDLKVTMQALGWRSGGRYLPLQDDIASVAYWYQTLPSAEFPKLPSKDELEII